MPLRRYAGINDVVIIAGVNRYVGIWGKENWEVENNLMESQAWQISEGIKDRF